MREGPPLPQTFGKYTLVERIAAGGMAEVYRAKSFGVAGFEKTVAVKRILPHFAGDDGFVKMFVREANVAVKLSHANVVQVFELGRVGDDYYIALEFVEGKDLKSLIKKSWERNVVLPPDLCAFVTQKVCIGLHHAHTATDDFGAPLGIVHRDVSPHNVLVSWSGEIKVADFGIAKLSSAARHTRTGTIKGKLAYMSPEQARGEADLDARSDVFAVGIVLFELLTGERPFEAETDRELLKKIQVAPTPLPGERVEGIPKELDEIVARAMEKDRAARYADAAQMGRALAQFLQRDGSRTGRIIDEESIAEVMRALMGPRPVSATPASRGGGTPALPLEDAAPAPSGRSEPTVPSAVSPEALAAEAGEVFATATPLSQLAPPSQTQPRARDVATVLPADTAGLRERREKSTSQATLSRTGLPDDRPRGGVPQWALGGMAALALAAFGFLATQYVIASGAATPAPVVSVAATPPAAIATPASTQVTAPVSGTLHLNGSPAGAAITIDRTVSGKLGQPISGIALGRHTALVAAEDYRSRQVAFELTPASPEVTQNVDLVRGRGEVRIGHGGGNDLRVDIPGVTKKGQELERSFENVPAGRYRGTVTRVSQQWPITVVVKDGGVTKVILPDDPSSIANREFKPE